MSAAHAVGFGIDAVVSEVAPRTSASRGSGVWRDEALLSARASVWMTTAETAAATKPMTNRRAGFTGSPNCSVWAAISAHRSAREVQRSALATRREVQRVSYGFLSFYAAGHRLAPASSSLP